MFFLILALIMLVSLIGFCTLKLPEGSGHSDDEEKPSFMEVTRSTINLMFTEKMMMLNMELMYSGAILAYWSCLLIPMMALEMNNTNPEYSEPHVDSLALRALVFFGVGEVVSSLIMGWVNDKIGAKFTCSVNVGVIIITTALTIWNQY